MVFSEKLVQTQPYEHLDNPDKELAKNGHRDDPGKICNHAIQIINNYSSIYFLSCTSKTI